MEYTIGNELIKIENLDYSIKGKTILRNIGNDKFPFIVENLIYKNSNKHLGQIVAVLGRSGSGKSTLFKMLTGLVTPNKGHVLIPESNNSEKLKKVSEGEVGFVQQNYPLSRNQSVYQMLMTACIKGKYSKRDSEDAIKQYLDSWGLSDKRNHYTNQLSGGQRQRVAIIEQLLCSHHFIVFDEPFSGLDVGNIMEVKESFRKIADDNDINTILFSTHDIDLAVEIADMIYVIGLEKEGNKYLDGGTIIESIDLKKLGLAWKEFSQGHKELSNQICNLMIHNSK